MVHCNRQQWPEPKPAAALSRPALSRMPIATGAHMAMDLVPQAAEAAPPWWRVEDDAQNNTSQPRARPALARGALLTAAKVALACVAILVVLPAALAAQVAIAR